MSFDQGSYEQEEENIRKAFAEKDATIAELRTEAANWKRNWSIAEDRLSELRQAIEDADVEAEVIELRAKLSEADAERTQAIHDAQLLSIEHGELREELVKLRAAVPEDVEREINDLCATSFKPESTYTQARKQRITNLLALIGALVTRSREERKVDIVDAFLENCGRRYSDEAQEAAEEYAERILKGE